MLQQLLFNVKEEINLKTRMCTKYVWSFFFSLKTGHASYVAFSSIKSILTLHADLLHDSIFNFFFPGLANTPQIFYSMLLFYILESAMINLL